MKRISIYITAVLICTSMLLPQSKEKDSRESLKKVSGITDRAAGTHNASNIGLFFENRGKLYPHSLTQGPSGEYPINSGFNYIYRLNPMIAFPNNVIQCRFTTDEEWEAAAGYNNKDSAMIAFSDKSYTWPASGWPVKDASGNPVVKSDQDSYCVYNDSANTKQVMGIQVNQTGYAYGISFAKNMIFFKYDVINKSQNTYNGMYFNMYVDLDVGDASGGAQEFKDDKWGLDTTRNMAYMYDSKGFSTDWNSKTGYMGVSFIKTPLVGGKELGMTDSHYMVYNNDVDVDTIQYGVISSSSSLYNSSLSSMYFHVPSSQNIHFDDPSTIASSGGDLLYNAGSGPYTIKPNDTLSFYVALIAGDDLAGLQDAQLQAQKTCAANFELPKAPNRPALGGSAGNKKAILYWDNSSELSVDAFSGETDFEGYRVYKSKDRGLTWEKLADYDVVNSIGSNTGLQYTLIDTAVINGIEYWYSITAYDRGSADVSSLESAIGTNLQVKNTVSITPRSDAIGRDPVSTASVTHYGTGTSNYTLAVDPIDSDSLAGNSYNAGFSYVIKKEQGNLKTTVTMTITDTASLKPYKYGFEFKSATSIDVVNLTTGATIGKAGSNYPTGGRTFTFSSEGFNVKFTDASTATADERPETGDFVTISFSVNVVKNNSDTIAAARPIAIGQKLALTDGVLFTLTPPELIKDVSRVGGTENINVAFSVSNIASIINQTYIVSTTGYGINGAGEGFVKLSVKSAAGDSITTADSVYNQGTISFKGLTGLVTFNAKKPPQSSNMFSVETVKPVLPGIRDKYAFTIQGSKIDKAKQKSSMNKIRVVPNPYVVSSKYETELGELRLEPLRQIQFTNLPAECTIYIFTVAADLVKTLHHSSNNGTEVWDLRTESGREIAPGVYIYSVKSQDMQYTERFAVIK